MDNEWIIMCLESEAHRLSAIAKIMVEYECDYELAVAQYEVGIIDDL